MTQTLAASSGAASPSTAASNKGSNNNNNNNLSPGAIAGIVIGVVAAVALFLGVLFYIWRQRQKNQEIKKEQNAAIAAAVVANNYSGKHPDKRRFSGLSNPEDGDLSELPIIGSTGDGNGSSITEGFSRNPSSRFKFEDPNALDGLGFQKVSPSADVSGEEPVELEPVVDEKDDKSILVPESKFLGAGLRITNPDNASVRTSNTLEPKLLMAGHFKSASNADSTFDSEDDDDLFRDRVKD